MKYLIFFSSCDLMPISWKTWWKKTKAALHWFIHRILLEDMLYLNKAHTKFRSLVKTWCNWFNAEKLCFKAKYFHTFCFRQTTDLKAQRYRHHLQQLFHLWQELLKITLSNTRSYHLHSLLLKGKWAQMNSVTNIY